MKDLLQEALHQILAQGGVLGAVLVVLLLVGGVVVWRLWRQLTSLQEGRVEDAMVYAKNITAVQEARVAEAQEYAKLLTAIAREITDGHSDTAGAVRDVKATLGILHAGIRDIKQHVGAKPR